MEVKIYSCSKCVGANVQFIKYGKTSSGKQRYQCSNCKATSVFKPQKLFQTSIFNPKTFIRKLLWMKVENP